MDSFTQEEREYIDAVRGDALKSVVRITVKGSEEINNGGSGFVVYRGKYYVLVFSCSHIFPGYDFSQDVGFVNQHDISAISYSGKEYKAVVCHISPYADLSLLKVNDTGCLDFEPVTFSTEAGDQNIGDIGILVGHPYDLPFTCAAGKLCGMEISMNGLKDMIYDYHSGPGSSGGPVFNVKGELVGVHLGSLAYSSLTQAASLEKILQFCIGEFGTEFEGDDLKSIFKKSGRKLKGFR